jgi:sporulation protein YtfJ
VTNMHPIENIMQTAMSEIKEMVDVNTIVGDPVISTDGATIIPITKVSFGFVAGGGEYGEKGKSGGQDSGQGQQQHPFAGGASSGVSICPVGFLVVDENNIQLLPVSGRTVVEHLIEAVPDFIAEIKEAFKRCRDKGVE